MILQQGTPPDLEESAQGLEFKHPEDIGGVWKEMSCTDCHAEE